MKEMFNSLTEREKKLLFVLLVFLLIMGSWFICIRPSLESYRSKSQELSTKETTLSQLKSELKLYQEAPNQLEVQQKTYNQLTKQYYSEKSNDQLSRLFTQKMEDYSLTPQSLTISDGADASSSSSSTTSSSSSSTSTSSSSSSENTSRVVTKTVTITYTGTLDHTKSFLTAVNSDMKHVIVSSFSEGTTSSSSSSTNTSSSISTSSSDQSYTVGFNVYMIKK